MSGIGGEFEVLDLESPDTNRTIQGKIDNVYSDRITGWACVEEDHSEKLRVKFITKSGDTYFSNANQFRDDILSAGLSDGYSGYEIFIPPNSIGFDEIVEVSVENSDVVLQAEPPFNRNEPVALNPVATYPAAIGRIDVIKDGVVDGWLYCADPHAAPVIMVDGVFATPIDIKLPRADVNASLGMTGNYGFRFKLTEMKVSSVVELYVLTTGGLTIIDEVISESSVLQENFFNQITAAGKVCRQEDAVAVVCWDGAHNPIGRAKVLYDVLRERRPVILFCYMFEEFGNRIWPPLRSLDIQIVSVPWKKRELYHRAIKKAGVQFDTVWICKPRYPSFELANVVASPNARLILDYDDNEDHFSRSPNSRDKPYGLTTINLSNYLASNIPARTAASVSLQKKFEAQLVRHARSVEPPKSATISDTEIRVGFIGTVRAHKGILEAARAIKMFAWQSKTPIVFHVYGDVQPISLSRELQDNGVKIVNNIPMAELQSHLRGMHVILTGYPNSTNSEITTYQISSKIGDALSAGKPVLVPISPSTADLADTDGIFLFNESTFGGALAEALLLQGTPTLPHEFTLEGAYESFEAAEEVASASPRASDAFLMLPKLNATGSAPTLLLLWKQQDAGMYGRRVDQVARAYKDAYPNHNVIILEFIHKSTVAAFDNNAAAFVSEQGQLLQMSDSKIGGGWLDDDVSIRQIYLDTSEKIADEFELFLLDNDIRPDNSVVVLFPIIAFFDKISITLRPYKTIVDIVDNQLSWADAAQATPKITQYANMCQNAELIIFNSIKNKKFFGDSGIIRDSAKTELISNWYTPPRYAFTRRRNRTSNRVNLVYSGNMNDRIDWQLLRKIAAVSNNVFLHVAGTVRTSNNEFLSLVELPQVIYHGPLKERETLQLLENIDVAVMPHKMDAVSDFMNPLKVHMYEAAGIPTIATDVPGISAGPFLEVAQDHDTFMALLREHVAVQKKSPSMACVTTSAEEYNSHITRIRSENNLAR